MGAASAQPFRTSVGLSNDVGVFRNWGFQPGLAVKHFFNRHSAGEAALLYSGGLFVNAFYEYHFKLGAQERLQAYLGGGPTIAVASTPIVIARPVAGLEYRLNQKPWTFALDWRPGFIITNDDDGNIFATNIIGVSFRYVLK